MDLSTVCRAGARCGPAALILGLAVASAEPGPPAPTETIFAEVAAEAGLDLRHRAGRSADYYMPEILGSGVALFDYDDDGDLDVYLVQSGRIASNGSTASERIQDRLFRNELVVGKDGSRQLRFVDVTDEAGIEAQAYGIGVAAGDYDNDGDVDIYVTNFGPNQLLRNNGDGTFEDVTAQSGTGDPGWGTSASFVDYDRDGWLDLYVGDYVHFSPQANRECHSPAGNREYCGPLSFDPQPDRLLRNRGDGSFEDASTRSGIHQAYGAALGVASADLNGDGWPDIYVANDQTANQLWVNQGDGTFSNEALLAGVAVNGVGAAEASMGVDAGDIDGDSDLDLFLSHLKGETNTAYLNDGQGLFTDRSRETGLATDSTPFTGFGAGWIDFDNDGWLDLLVVNGEVRVLPELTQARDPDPYRQSNQLFQNLGGGRFRDVSARGGTGITAAETSRGAAFGDLDNDGDTDVVVQNNDGPVRVLLNQVGNRNAWIGLRLIDPSVKRDALGAQVTVVTTSGRTLHRHVHMDGSYASANDPRVLFGLGKDADVEEIRVRWPDGGEEFFNPPPLREYNALEKGSGSAVVND